MYNKKPPFTITNTILSEIAEIAELVGQVNATAGMSSNPLLRRTNRIRSIHGSLAIEQNTLTLAQWKPLFAWLPVESIIHDRQEEYYHAINRSNAEGESTAFIVFMLSAIKEALMEVVQTNGAAQNRNIEERRRSQIERFLREHGTITNADVRQLLQVSSATANRILTKLVEDGKIQKIRLGRSWGYVVK